jgi:predicted DNA-binding ribbon-helix-helix protein
LSAHQSQLKVRGFRLARRKTSVSLEDAFWEAARAIATARRISIQALIAEIDAAKCDNVNLSSAIRTFVLEYYRDIATEYKSVEASRTAARDTFNGAAAGSAPAAR